jgi:hypothetical protein
MSLFYIALSFMKKFAKNVSIFYLVHAKGFLKIRLKCNVEKSQKT